MRSFGYRPIVAACAAAVVLMLVAPESDARPRMNSGSRGSQTWSAPPATKTAPNTARPVERTMTQPGQPGTSAARPTTPAQQPGGFFNRPGLLGGLAAGFLGAGLFGLLFGQGLFGGLGGLASMLGLILQVGLVALLGYLAWTWWQRRNQPQHAYAGGPSMRNRESETVSNTYARDGQNDRPAAGGGLGALGGGLGGFGASRAAPVTAPIQPTGADFDTFERLLGEIQTAYGAEDINSLSTRLTPEMLSYFAEELEANKKRGVVNRISNVKLLQGDLAEAWREGNDEYATVAVRYSLNDETVDRQSGRVIEGGPDEATEVWTFLRPQGGDWQLSAIQQTA